MERLLTCPICAKSERLKFSGLTVPDHSLSKESFTIDCCEACALLFTNPRPDAEEIGVYYQFPEYISHQDEAPGLINKLYRVARKWTTNQKLALLDRVTPRAAPKTLLDYGCGTGYFLHAAKEAHWKVEGLEVSETARAAASARTQQPVAASLAAMPAEARYQVITLWHVLEHIHDLNAVFATLISKLAPQGVMLVAVPNYNSVDAQFYAAAWAAYDVPRHLYHFSQKSISVLAEQNGARIEATIPQPMDAFYISLLSAKYSGKNPIQGLVKGLYSNFKAAGSKEFSSLIYVIKKQ